MTTQLYRERQLWSGNECVEIRYVNGSFAAGTSALSPGVPRHMYTNNSKQKRNVISFKYTGYKVGIEYTNYYMDSYGFDVFFEFLTQIKYLNVVHCAHLTLYVGYL